MSLYYSANRVIEAEIIFVNNIENRTLFQECKRIHFMLQRRQLPVVVCFAMTINKSQRQSLSNVSFKKTMFIHGQLYVALFGITSKVGLDY